MTNVQVSILGPVEVTRDGRPVAVGGSRVRRLLTRLALDAGRPVGQASLSDAVWGADVPGELPNALQSLVSRLRRALGDPGTIVTTPAGGYRLALAPDAVDAVRFTTLADEVHGRADTAAVALADEALALWRGEPLADLDPTDAGADIARLRGLHRRLVEDRAEALLRDGDADRVERDLRPVFEADPTAERIAALLMRALVATGRPAEALAAYERARAALAEAFGADPSGELQRQHLAVLRAEDGAGDTPTRPARSNLPAATTSFVGREGDLHQVGRLLRDSRLVTLVGPGGAGKTRLAIEAGRLARRFVADGVWLVELARLTDPGDVVTAVVEALGAWDVVPFDVRVRPRSGPAQRLTDALGDSAVMLVLDNCEHVLDAVAGLAENLLASCPQLRVLTTSREPLAVAGESLYPVPPLQHDTAGRSASELLQVPAVTLFADRVRAMSPAFEVTDANAEAVARICERLDGLPLALELAAARCRGLPVEQVAERLGDRFRLLTGGSRTALPRHRTLRAVVEWSWGLLTGPERELAERLAVYPAGVDLDATRDLVARSEIEGDADDLVAALVDKSLLQLIDGGRYRMLETIREFGTDRLAERRELAGARAAHADYYLALAKHMEPRLRSREQLGWIARATIERDNFLSALQLLCDTGRAVDAVDLAVSLTWLWTLRGEHTAVVTWLRRALDVPLGTADATGWTQARTLAVGLLAMNLGAVEGMPAGRRLVEAHRDRLLVASTAADGDMLVLVRALVPVFLADTSDARGLIDRDLQLDGLSDWVRATLLMIRSYAEENDGDIEAMRGSMTESAAAFDVLGERFGLSSSLEGIGRLQTLDGDLESAIDSYTRSGQLLAELGAEDDSGQSALRVASLQLRLGRMADADDAVTLARSRFERLGSRIGLAIADCTASALARERGEFVLAVELAESAQARYFELGTDRGPEQLLAMCLVAQANAEADAAHIDSGGPGTSDADALERAGQLLVQAHRAAVSSTDMPVVAMVALASAVLAERRADRRAAATLLGAADAIRGATDATDLDVRRLETVLAGDDALTALRADTRAAGRDSALALLPAG